LVVGGLWAKGKMGTCQLSIKKLQVANEKGVSLAPGGLVCFQRRSQMALFVLFELGVVYDWL